MNGIRNSELGKRGLKYTKIYLILLFGGIPVAGYFGLIELHPMTLNTLGDFLAGAFGPLAIFWLVLGFFQQSEELRNSVDALNLQAKELAESVEQQKQLVSITNRQLALDEKSNREATRMAAEAVMPHVSISQNGSEGSGASKLFRFRINNTGQSADLVTLSAVPDLDGLHPREFQILRSEDFVDFVVSFNENHAQKDFAPGQMLIVESRNKLGWKKVQTFEIGNFAPRLVDTEVDSSSSDDY